MGRRTENARSLYLEAIGEGNYVEAINTYAGERYTQHSTPVKDGKEGFIEFFADFVRRNPVRDIEIIRAFEEGQYVFVHAVQTLNNGEYRYVTADIFDTDDDARLIEHWDVIEALRDAPVGGRSQVDGPTAVSGLDETGANKQLVTGFVNDVLVPGDYDRLGEFVSEDLAQHSVGVADGLDAFAAFATASAMHYVELRLVVGAGNFVATLAENEIDGDRQAVIDLFRVDEGKIVEHWDVIEPITPEDTWVNTGKF